ncbi:hypothetical protein [Cognatishimia activa]|uniref:Uncharacterized protein n=1 Tax=Cognatishimia activa TaxID=1715691 RepID=A0A0N7MC17_9RHOB|nr:hypothetical protein [Cognatishimia activa]CUJ37620.1 hypothetical protein TA5113_03224 [Cognatishimia activa]CUK26960.1 hypothetical protein TA5114_02779 [Cognatishimia activa]
MNFTDRNTVVSIFVNLTMITYVIYKLVAMNAAGAFDGPDAVNVWARMVIWLIGYSIVATIVGTILFNIVHSIVTNQANPSFVVDERDRMFERRGAFAVIGGAGVGFVGAIIALAMNYSALVGFNIMYFGMAAGALGSDLVRFASYRRGY